MLLGHRTNSLISSLVSKLSLSILRILRLRSVNLTVPARLALIRVSSLILIVSRIARLVSCIQLTLIAAACLPLIRMIIHGRLILNLRRSSGLDRLGHVRFVEAIIDLIGNDVVRDLGLILQQTLNVAGNICGILGDRFGWYWLRSWLLSRLMRRLSSLSS